MSKKVTAPKVANDGAYVSTRSKLEDLSAHIKGVECFNVKSGGGSALFAGVHGKCTGYDAPIVVRYSCFSVLLRGWFLLCIES